MKDLKLAIFDMDGLLFDTEKVAYLAMKIAAEKAGFTMTHDIFIKLVGISGKNSDKILLETYGEAFFEKQVLKGFREEFQRILHEEGLGIKPGAVELLDALDKKGIKKCIASSSSRETIHNYLSISGLADRFNFYISGSEVENGKPSPDIFLEACRRANEKPEDAIVFEDSYNGFKAAKSANIRCIIIPDMIEPNDEMKDGAYRILSDLGKAVNLI